jgi:hypothetical protein
MTLVVYVSDFSNSFTVDIIAMYRVLDLEKLPPDFLNTMRALDPTEIRQVSNHGSVFDMFERIYELVRQSSFQTWFTESKNVYLSSPVRL